jgi:hypothetical protein
MDCVLLLGSIIVKALPPEGRFVEVVCIQGIRAGILKPVNKLPS